MKYSDKRNLVYLRRLKRLIIKYWLELITIHIFIIALFVYINSDTVSTAAQFGDFLAGFAGSLAFLWLIASFKLQGKELQLQRKELSLQRKALEHQTVELKNMGEFAALEQVSHIIERAIKKLEQEPEDFNSPIKLLHATFNPLTQYKTIKKSNNPKTVQDAYLTYLKQFLPVKEFIDSTAVASKLYLKGTGNLNIDDKLESVDFLLKYKEKIQNIPHISEYFNTIIPVLDLIVRIKPTVESIHFAGTVAVNIRIDSSEIFVDKERILEHYRNSNLEIPVIIQDFIYH